MADLSEATRAESPAAGGAGPSAARWPWLVALAFVLLAGTGLTLHVVNGGVLADQVSYVVAFSAFSIVGALIVSRDRRNVIGILLLWSASMVGFSFSGGELFTWLIRSGRNGSLAVFSGLMTNVGWLLGILPVVFLLALLFPDGHPPSRRWRPLVWFVGIFLTLAGIDIFLGQATLTGSTETENLANPFFVEAVGDLPSLDPVFAVLFPSLVVAPAISLILRFRRSTGVARQQIKWVAFGFLAAATGIVLGSLIADPVLNSIVFGGVFLAFPVSIGISVLRFHLYDLDVVVKKGVVYAALAIFATVVYLGLVLGLGTWLGRGSSFLTMVAAVVVAVTFQPARARAQRLADRVVYGARATPYEILSEFSERVGEAYGETDVLPRMARVLGEGVGAERSDVWLMVGHELRQVAAWPPVDGAADAIVTVDGAVPLVEGMDRTYPVEHAGEMLGALAVRKPPSDPITPADEKLISGLASQAGLVLANVSLTEALKLRLEDLSAAQRRLVTAQDEERRKIERNIHDGAQQQLVALQVRQRLAAQFVDRDPTKAKQMLEDIQADTGRALEDLRDLARGIYPPLLADKGLAAALESQGRKSAIPVVVESGEVERYPQEVEAAVYFSVLEALQNTAKYAQASRATVVLARDDGSLTFRVIDDGVGFDTRATGHGTGLRGIADRLGALGGEIEVRSAEHQGTTVIGRIPVGAVASRAEADAG